MKKIILFLLKKILLITLIFTLLLGCAYLREKYFMQNKENDWFAIAIASEFEKMEKMKLELEKNKNIQQEKDRVDQEIEKLQVYISEIEQTNKEIEALDKYLGGKLKNKGKVFWYAAQFYDIDPIQQVAIVIHETGNGTSNAIKDKNNVGGIMADANKGILKYFKSVDRSIIEMARLLRHNYYDEGKDTIKKIGPKYCPVGVSNDPKGLNKHWIPNVTELYDKIKNGIDKN